MLCTFGLLTSCQLAPDSNPEGLSSLKEQRLEELLAPIEQWPSGMTTNYSRSGWERLVSAAKVIQTSNPNSVEKSLLRCQWKGCANGNFQLANERQAENDRKLLLLIRVVFDVSEAVPAHELHEFAGWIPTKSLFNPDGTANQAWPIKWNRGYPTLVSGFIGIQGIDARYNAAKEFHYFQSRYPLRDLSSFQYATNNIKVSTPPLTLIPSPSETAPFDFP